MGSSATMRSGSVTIARARSRRAAARHRTACAGSGRCVRLRPTTPAAQSPRARMPRPRRVRQQERRRDVVARVEHADQVEELEESSTWRAPLASSISVSSPSDCPATALPRRSAGPMPETRFISDADLPEPGRAQHERRRRSRGIASRTFPSAMHPVHVAAHRGGAETERIRMSGLARRDSSCRAGAYRSRAVGGDRRHPNTDAARGWCRRCPKLVRRRALVGSALISIVFTKPTPNRSACRQTELVP